jgi:hypothetical protein
MRRFRQASIWRRSIGNLQGWSLGVMPKSPPNAPLQKPATLLLKHHVQRVLSLNKPFTEVSPGTGST